MTIDEAKKIIVEEYAKALKNDTSVGGRGTVNPMYEKIDKLLKQRGESVNHMLKVLGMNQPSYSMKKKRGNDLSAFDLYLVAQYLGKPMEYFMEVN